VRGDLVDNSACRCPIHLDDHDLGLEIIQVKADGVCKPGVASLFLDGDNMTAALDHVLDEAEVAKLACHSLQWVRQ
jgi:hypothetical protein